MIHRQFVAAAVTAAVFALAGTSASAQNYVGLNVGISHNYDLNCVTGAACDRGANSTGKLTFGHLFDAEPAMGGTFANGIELMGFRAAEAKAGFRTAAGLVSGNGVASGYGLSYAPQLNLGDLALKGRVGVAYVKGSVNYAGGGASDDSSFVPTVGAGASYALNKTVALSLDYDRVPTRFSGTEKANVNMWSVGLSYKF